MPIQPDVSPRFEAIQAPPPTGRATLADRQRLMAAAHVHRPTIGLGSPTAMSRAPLASRGRRAGVVSRRPRRLRRSFLRLSCVTATSKAAPGGRLLGALLGPVAEHQHAQPLETEACLLQGKQEPKIPLQHLL